MTDDPWLQIPARDYEAHMDAVGQSAVLRDFFGAAYAERRPKRLAILGCTTGGDFEHVDPSATELIVGVDLNGDYLEIARRRWGALGPRLSLIHSDVLLADLPPVPFDLVHAALLLEYVDPLALFRRAREWLSPDGICSVVTQEPIPDAPAVSATSYESLRTLAERMCLRSAIEIAALAGDAGLRRVRARQVNLPTGKTLVHATFDRAR